MCLYIFNVSILYLFKPLSVNNVPRIGRKIIMAINFSSAQFSLSSSSRAFLNFTTVAFLKKVEFYLTYIFWRTFTFLEDHYIATFIYLREESLQWLSVQLDWDSHQWLTVINAIPVILSNVIKQFSISRLCLIIVAFI